MNNVKETNRLIIREIKEEDYLNVLEIYRNRSNMKYILTGKYDWTLEELKEKWKKEKYRKEDKTGFLVVSLKSTEKIIGECGLLKTQKPVQEELELAYLIDEKYWGKGIGTEICNFLIREGFENLGVQNLSAGMYKENIGSSKIVKKLGLILEREFSTKTGIGVEEYKLNRKNYFKMKFKQK